MNGKLVNVSLCFMSGMKQPVRSVEKDTKNLMDSPGWVILLVLMIMGFTFGCLEYRFGDRRTGENILWFLLICSIPLYMIAKALTNKKI